MKTKAKQIVGDFFTSKPSYLDAIFYLAVLVLCYFCFNQGDILYPGGSSFVYLDGHIRDFYDVNKELMGGAAYLPSIYILYAVWNLPLKLLGIVTQATINVGYVIFWYKLLTTLFFAGSAYFLYKIGGAIGLDKTKSMLLTALWISTPILFFGQFIFGQCDVITIFFVLVGLYYYLRKNIWLFLLFFGISLTFKYFSVFLLIPLILLIEKNPFKALGFFALACILPACEIAFYAGSPVFWSELTGYGFIDRIFTASINVYYTNVNIGIFLLIWFVICGICYYLKLKNDQNDFYQTAVYVCLAAVCTLFVFVMWHPQYLVFMTPFIIIASFMSRRIKYFLLLDFILMVAFVGFTVIFWQSNVDQSMMGLGLLGKFNPALGDPEKVFKMYKFFTFGSGRWDMFLTIYRTLFSAILILNVILKFPHKWDTWKGNSYIVPVTEYWNYARLSFFGGMAVFIIPAFAAYFLTLMRS